MKAQTSAGEVYIAVDEGILVKTGREVLMSVRNAIGGSDLGELHDTICSQFLELDEQERNIRSTLAKLESGFIRRFAGLKHEYYQDKDQMMDKKSTRQATMKQNSVAKWA